MFNLNLQQKAISIIAVILFVVLTINTAVLTYNSYEQYRQTVLSQASAIGEGFQRDVAKTLKRGVPIEDMEGTGEKLKDAVNRNNSFGYAMITDSKGKVLYHNENENISKELNDPISQKALSSGKPLVQSGASFYDLSFPILNPDGKSAGTLRIGVKSSAFTAQLSSMLTWSFAISALCFLLSLGLVYAAITRFITNPILNMEKASERIASGDLTSTLEVKGTDEIASLGNRINMMAGNLKDMLSKISSISNSVSTVTLNIASSSSGVLASAAIQKKVVEETTQSIGDLDNSISQIADSAEILSKSAGDTSSAIMQMSASIQRISENSNIFSETAHDTASSIEEMVSTIKQIGESLENLSSSSEAIASSIEEVNTTTRDIERRANESVKLAEAVMINASEKGMNSASVAMTGMENIKKSVLAISEVTNMLGNRTADIGKIVKVIDDVADQTNLLALNAAILASKAGEHGKGFTIVADEIKNLAERTSVSTNEISSLIKSVQEATKSSIRMANEGIQTVEKGLLLVKDVSGALNEIVDSSKASTDMARAIQRATTEEALVIKQITDAVEGMTVQTENISRAIQEQGKGSRMIIEATDKVKELSHQVMTSTNEQKYGSRQISKVIEDVTQQASQIARVTGKQKDKSIEIVQSMDKIHTTTDKLISSAHEMNAIIAALKEEAVNLLSELKKFRV